MKNERRIIAAIDLKSFYASVECVDRGLDPFNTALVVADESRGDGTIVLAASPYIKSKYNVPSRCRLKEVDKSIPNLIIATPRMKRYLEISAKVNLIYLNYVSEEDMYVYSIDESFLDITNYLKRENNTPKSYVLKIIKEIKDKLGLTVTAGVGLNMFMAKAAMDIEAKKNKDFIAVWNYSDIPSHLWPISPLSKMWGIGQRLEKRLNKLGFYTIGDIAISDKEYLKKNFGVIGEEIYFHANGYDDARLQDVYISQNNSLSVGQVLLRDFYTDEIPTLIRDMAFELSDRMYEKEVIANNFVMYLGFHDDLGGIVKKLSLSVPTCSSEIIGKNLVEKFKEEKNEHIYRRISIIACNITNKDNYQTSLFEDFQEEERISNLENTVIKIRKKYGVRKALPCSALTMSSTHLQRSNQIGGHHA